MKTGHHFPTQIPLMNPNTLKRNSKGSAWCKVCTGLDTASPHLLLLWQLFSSCCFPYCSCLSHSDLFSIPPRCLPPLLLPQGLCTRLYSYCKEPNDLLHSPQLSLYQPHPPSSLTLHSTLFLTLLNFSSAQLFTTWLYVSKDVSRCGCIYVCIFCLPSLNCSSTQARMLNCSLLQPFACNSTCHSTNICFINE